MAEFNYSAFFRRIQDLKQLQIKAEDVSWIEKHRDARPRLRYRAVSGLQYFTHATYRQAGH